MEQPSRFHKKCFITQLTSQRSPRCPLAAAVLRGHVQFQEEIGGPGLSA